MARHIKAAIYTLLLILGFIYLPLGVGRYVIPEIVPDIYANGANIITWWVSGALFAFMVFAVAVLVIFIYREFLDKDPQQDM